MINPLKYFRNSKVGLALGSGGAKGIAHIAVIEYLEQMKIPVGMIAGSSIGALVGAVYACGSMAKFKSDIIKMSTGKFFSYLDPVFPRSGLIEGKAIMKFLSNYIPPDARIETLSVPLAIVATDFNTGSSVVFRSGNVLESVRASISIPGIFVPVKYNDTYLIDGGVSNPIPVNIVKEMGAGITVAVNLHPRIPARMIAKKSSQAHMIKTETQIVEKSKDKQGHDWYDLFGSIKGWISDKKNRPSDPNIFEVISRSVDIMEFINTVQMLKYHNPTLLIEPDLLDIGTMQIEKAEYILGIGSAACDARRNYIIRKIKCWI